ncbi:hypothetical protein GCM10010123_22700 [Pilimelia anulata]|uniref:Uncharacterized protein n=1 Tax=Pilimelia anulata TaxID=53371 RepID=A0A8J3B342_9ACTN|nr:hypothetical protein [Pilimelia anulata]GGJ92335.1 hypothetical protein GCM10010123_22700 [Pilimelia anulata]
MRLFAAAVPLALLLGSCSGDAPPVARPAPTVQPLPGIVTSPPTPPDGGVETCRRMALTRHWSAGTLIRIDWLAPGLATSRHTDLRAAGRAYGGASPLVDRAAAERAEAAVVRACAAHGVRVRFPA